MQQIEYSHCNVWQVSWNILARCLTVWYPPLHSQQLYPHGNTMWSTLKNTLILRTVSIRPPLSCSLYLTASHNLHYQYHHHSVPLSLILTVTIATLCYCISRLPVHIHDLMVSLGRAERHFVAQNSRKPSSLELAERLALPLRKVSSPILCFRL